MKKEFVKTIYDEWKSKNNQSTADLDRNIQKLDDFISSLEGQELDRQSVLDLSNRVGDEQAAIHRAGFYAGFEAACGILREMVDGSDE